MRTSVVALLLVMATACAYGDVATRLDEESPNPALGRPGWVRAPAAAGAWVGGAGGWLASIVTLPLTYPIALLAEEPLGYARDEFLFWGAPVGASTGQFILGAPLDSVDWVFRRAWILGPEVTIDDTRQPILPSGSAPAAQNAAAENPPADGT